MSPLPLFGATDVTNLVQHKGQINGNQVSAIRHHQGKIYMINGKGAASSPAIYYDVSTGRFGQNGSIETESPYGASVKYGDLLWYGEDLAGLGGTSALYRLKQDGWKYYIPPGANAHRQSQTLFDGKIFASTWTRQFPGSCISSNDGASWNNVSLQGQNGFASQLEGKNVVGAPINRYFEFRGNLFGVSIDTYLNEKFSNGSFRSTATSENYMMRYTGDPAKPWELALRRFSSLEFKGLPDLQFWRVTDTTKPGFTYYTEFKGYLFLEHSGVVNRYGHKTVASLSNPNETYDVPNGAPVVVSNFVIDSNGNFRDGWTLDRAFLTPRNGYLYRMQYDLEIDQISFWRTSDATNWEKVCYVSTAVGSPFRNLDSKTLSYELVGSDIYICTPDRNLYKIPGSSLGALALNGNMNTAPVANNDTFTADRGLIVTDSMKGLLLNDTDADNDAIYTSLVSQPANGIVTVNYNGTFQYQPAGNFAGTDTFVYRVTDGFSSKNGTVTINNLPNVGPSNLSISAESIRDGRPVGSVVGLLSTTDSNAADTHTYNLVAGDVDRFSIVGNELRTAAIFDVEVKNSYSLTIRTTDLSGASFDKPITITVIPGTRRSVDGTILFGNDGSAYGSNQDGGNGRPTSVIVSGDKRAVTISGNVWKKFPLSYTVTTKTVMEFTVSGSDTGEILALALDNDDINTNPGPGNLKRAFLVGGSDADVVGGEDWAAQVIPSYIKNAPARTYLIPVGTYFTGGVVNFGLIGDDDADGSTNITFSNVRLYESGAYDALRATFDWGSTPVADRDANDDANKNGVSNLLEFAFNMSPTAPGDPTTLKPGTGTSGMPAVSVITPETPTLRIEYLRRKNSGLSYKVKFSDDLVTWEDAIANPTPTSINTDWERMIMPDTAGAGRKKRFAKVEVKE